MDRSHGKGYLRNAQLIVFLSKLADFSIIFLTLMAFAWLYKGTSWDAKFAILGMVSLMIFLLTSEVAHLYRSWRGVSFSQEFFRICSVWAATVLILLLLAYAFKSSSIYSRVVVVSWFAGVPLVMGAVRLLVRKYLGHMRAKGHNSRNVAIVGAGEVGIKLFNTIQCAPWLGMRLAGFYDDRILNENRMSWDGKLEGDLEQLLCDAKAREIDLIYITLPLTAQLRIMELIDKLADTTASVYLVPDLFVFNLFHGNWTNIEGLPMVSVFDTPFWGIDGWMKRAQDIGLSTLILALIVVPMLVIAATVKLTSSGPVLFKQRRYGADGKEIHVWKFRSMSVLDDGDRIVQATRNDSRITPVGAFLRRTSLDELPQFINVLAGEMSIVGPRPHAVAHNEEYRGLIKGYMLRHAVKPGITGWAQVNGWRGETDTLNKMEVRVEHDLWYIRNWSFWLDLKIVFLTVFKGFVGKHVY